ncbi:uncharacterized protein LOC105641013 isoform X1 [Jatropha curcas]|uniref:uncharacterized protein LOC105641013 isoform X1 n=1 Tax=Jatropha curcas TaxID=180498 RepID=UPI0018956044|nr:uncharacterized protein LOC105641013 isoform X1 [Jatropha curcas]
MESQVKNNKRKKTRDLPNLSECHSCGFRIDSCTGNNRLHTLYSEWRIVLLCKICFIRVESSQLCSYCFKGSSDNCFNCLQCKRIIHKSCLFDYATVSPWSFSSSSSSSRASQFSVCVDCWVPKYIADKRACYFRPIKRNKLLEGVDRDANCSVQRTVAAARARELAVKKALAARQAAELAQNALDLVAERYGSGCAGGGIHDDMELSLQFHGVMNSSPRILKNFCFVSSRCLDVPNPWVRAGVCRKLEVSNEKSVSDPSVCVTTSGYDSSVNMDSLGSDGLDDIWIRTNDKESDVELLLNYRERRSFNKPMNSQSQSCREGDVHGLMEPAEESYNRKPGPYALKYSRRTPADKRYNGKPGRCLIKYARRTTARETYDGMRMQDRYLIKYSRRTPSDERYNEKPDRYLKKYTRRKFNQRSVQGSRSCFVYEGVYNETKASAIGQMLSCSKESVTSSKASLQACPFYMQVSCSSDLSGDKT